MGVMATFEPVMCGTDRMADFGMPTIFEFLAMGMPIPVMYVVMMFFQRFIAGFFTHLFLRDIFKLPAYLSTLGGMAFSLGAARGEPAGVEWIYVHFLHEPAFPLLLYVICRLDLSKMTRLIWGAIFIGLFIAISSQVDIGPFFTLPCAFLFGFIARDDVKNWRIFNRFILMCAIVVGSFLIYQIPHIWAALLNVPLSSRDVLLTSKSFGDAWYLIHLKLVRMWPHLLLVLIWIIKLKWRRREEVALVTLLLVTIVLGTMTRPLLSSVGENFGVLSSFNTNRLFLYAPFFVLCAAMIGLHRMPMPNATLIFSWRTWHLEFPVTAIIAFTLAVIIVGQSITSGVKQWNDSLALSQRGENWHRLYSNPDLKALAARIDSRPIRTVTVDAEDNPAAWQPAFNLAYGLETADGYRMIYPLSYHQFWRLVVDSAYQLSEKNLTRRFMDIDGSRMFIFPPERRSDTIHPLYNLNLLSLANVGYFISQKPLLDSRLIELDPLYPDEKFAEWQKKNLLGKIDGLFTGDYLGQRLRIYENPFVFPRHFVVEKVKLFKTEAELLSALKNATIEDLKANAFVLARHWPKEIGSIQTKLPVNVEIVEYKPHQSRIRLKVDSTAFLIISNTYSKYWKCHIDGVQTPVYPANHTFMGIIVPQGEHTLTVSYKPPYGF
jgi:hypothetical protein